MIVADANLIAYFVMPGERTEEAERVFQADPAWVAPVLWASEMRSVLLGQLRAKTISASQAERLMDRAEQVIAGRVGEPRSARVLELALRSGCSSYDCEYVALAEELGVPLISSDRKLAKAFPKVVQSPAEFAAGSNP